MPAVGKYDTALSMFVEPKRHPKMTHVGFLRFLAERGELEHRPAGAPSGPLTDDAATGGDHAAGGADRPEVGDLHGNRA